MYAGKHRTINGGSKPYIHLDKKKGHEIAFFNKYFFSYQLLWGQPISFNKLIVKWCGEAGRQHVLPVGHKNLAPLMVMTHWPPIRFYLLYARTRIHLISTAGLEPALTQEESGQAGGG
jgi:hypothetical protein